MNDISDPDLMRRAREAKILVFVAVYQGVIVCSDRDDDGKFVDLRLLAQATNGGFMNAVTFALKEYRFKNSFFFASDNEDQAADRLDMHLNWLGVA